MQEDLSHVLPAWSGIQQTLGRLADKYERKAKQKRTEQKSLDWFVDETKASKKSKSEEDTRVDIHQ